MQKNFTPLKNEEHETIKNRTLKPANTSVLHFGKCGLRQREGEERNMKRKGWGKEVEETKRAGTRGS